MQRLILGYSCAVIMVVCLRTKAAVDDRHYPVVVIRPYSETTVVGEPLLLDISCQNRHNVQLPMAYLTPTDMANSGITLEFRSHQTDVINYWINPASCAKQIGAIRHRDSGEWTSLLDPGEAITCRKVVIACVNGTSDGDDEERTPSAPLPPGDYGVICKLYWGDRELVSQEITIHVVEASTHDEEIAGSISNAALSRFLARGAGTGAHRLADDGSPPECVKQLVQSAPNSIHARIARSVVLLLQCERLNAEFFSKMRLDSREKEAALRDALVRIDVHLREHPRDPFANEFLYRKAMLFRDLDDVEALRSAVTYLQERFPDSWYAEDAKRRMDAFLGGN